MFDSTARLPVKLVERLLVLTSYMFNCSNKLKTVLLSKYKALGD